MYLFCPLLELAAASLAAAIYIEASEQESRLFATPVESYDGEAQLSKAVWSCFGRRAPNSKPSQAGTVVQPAWLSFGRSRLSPLSEKAAATGRFRGRIEPRTPREAGLYGPKLQPCGAPWGLAPRRPPAAQKGTFRGCAVQLTVPWQGFEA